MEKLNEDWIIRVSTSYEDKYSYYETFIKFQYYIIFLQSTEYDNNSLNILNEQMIKLQNSLTWNYRGLFIIISESQNISMEELSYQIFEELWKYYSITDVILLTSNINYTQIVNAKTSKNKLYLVWEIYIPNMICDKIQNSTLVDKCISIGNSDITPRNDYRNYLNDSKTFSGCNARLISFLLPPVTMSVKNSSEFKGYEVDAVLLILQKLNMSVNFKLLKRKYVEDNYLNQYIYTFQELNPSSFDIAIGGLPFNAYYNPFQAESTIPYITLKIKWIVPCPEHLSRWIAFIKIYSLPVWICIISSIVLTSITMKFLAGNTQLKLVREYSNYMTIASCLYNVFAITIGNSVSKMPRSKHVKLLFGLLIWCFFGLTMIYQTFFTGFLMNPGYEEGIRSVEDLIDSGIKIGFIGRIEGSEFSDPIFQIMKERTIKCNSFYKCLEMVVKFRNCATISDGFHVEYFKIRLSYFDRQLPICSLENEIMQFSVSTYMGRGNPILNIFNIMIRRLFEAGLYSKWWEELLSYLRLENKSIEGDDVDYEEYEEVKDSLIFSLIQLQIVFYALIIGQLASVFVLFGELLHYRMSRKKEINSTRNEQSRMYQKRLQASYAKFQRHSVIIHDIL
ncbi:hypothetical protein L9F63_014773 [Diploptera punctata]|uniref:Ionotropic glutamate receptor C-terminal domain-containing protein n=1 Tax=Diploptera punctata TaxID=6984 RepID=A0AAD8A9C3_DIPPU|nr:hypothetical protein L9F63_014773 [Diploptera punctata]